MKCPKCKSETLVPSYLDGLFRAHGCKSCGGIWFLIESYVAWKERNPEHEFSNASEFKLEDSKGALICPVSGTVMQKYRIAHDTNHRLDYSPSVGGVWLDSGEWEFLKAQKIAGSLNKIFTSYWQKSIRENSAKVTFSDMYEARFGRESYAKAREIREWLSAHPLKEEIRAYILAEDPYSADK